MDDFLEAITLALPYELRLMVYSYTFSVDFRPMQKLAFDRNFTRMHSLPPRDVFFKNDAYMKLRRSHVIDPRSTQWLENVEIAFFKAIEWTYSTTYQRPKNAQHLLTVGSEGERLLQDETLSLRFPWNRFETIGDIILTLTERRVPREDIASQFQVLRDIYQRFLHVPQDRSSDLTFKISLLSGSAPAPRHGALYKLLHVETFRVGCDIEALETIHRALAL